QKGESGSGVLRAGDQSLVGVIWGSDGTGSAATGLDDIRRFLEQRCCRWSPQLQPRQPLARPQPIQPSPTPAGESALLRGEVDRLRHELAELRQRPPQPGPAGPPGPKGDPGPAGDPAALQQEVKQLQSDLQS